MKTETIQTVQTLIKAAIHDADEQAAALAAIQRGSRPERPDKLITGVEAARLAGVHRKTIRDWEGKGLLHGKHITRSRVRFSRNELEDLLGEKLGA